MVKVIPTTAIFVYKAVFRSKTVKNLILRHMYLKEIIGLKKYRNFSEKIITKIWRFQKNAYLCIRVRQKRIRLNNWCGSSAG